MAAVTRAWVHLQGGPAPAWKRAVTDPTQRAWAPRLAALRVPAVGTDKATFWAAWEHHDDRALRGLLSCGAPPNPSDGRMFKHEFALHKAARQPSLERLALLLGARADREVRNHEGRTPLAVAAAAGQRSAVDALLAAGARADTPQKEPDRIEPETRCVLGCAAFDLGILASLMAAGAPLSPPWPGHTPVAFRATEAQTPLELNAFLGLIGRHGGGPADRTAQRGRSVFMAFVFHLHGHPDTLPPRAIVKALLDHGHDPFALDDEGNTTWHLWVEACRDRAPADPAVQAWLQALSEIPGLAALRHQPNRLGETPEAGLIRAPDPSIRSQMLALWRSVGLAVACPAASPRGLAPRL